jgi:hypothetical protein
MRDLPAISSSTYGSTAVNLAAVGPQMAAGVCQAIGENFADKFRLIQAQQAFVQPNQAKQEKIQMATRRLVQVFIADPNENIPLDKSLLYTGEQKLTDATDQELFFEIDIKGILEKHNEMRSKIVDKKVKERTEYLEPAKIRDLKMVVVAIAQF